MVRDIAGEVLSRWFLRAAVLCAAGALACSACSPSEPPPRQYTLQGQILAVRPDTREVLIKHGDIEGFMPGMTMPFRVKDPSLLEGASPGDLVQATLMVGRDEAWIASIAKTGSAPLAEPAAIPAAAFASPVEPGAAAPVTVLTGDRGEPLSLADWRGSAAAVTFIYVDCPLPQFCPMLDRRFAEVQQRVAGDPSLKGRVRLLSVSFDPDADTPERLREHARRLGADPAVWRFATAPREVVDRFAAAFGVNVIREPDRTITHNMRTAVIGPDGRVVSVHDGSDWTAEQLVADLRRALAE